MQRSVKKKLSSDIPSSTLPESPSLKSSSEGNEAFRSQIVDSSVGLGVGLSPASGGQAHGSPALNGVPEAKKSTNEKGRRRQRSVLLIESPFCKEQLVSEDQA